LILPVKTDGRNVIPAGLPELSAHPRQQKFYRSYNFYPMAMIDSPLANHSVVFQVEVFTPVLIFFF